MIEKLRKNLKTVDSLQKPQILMITQDTLKVIALFKALRDKYAKSTVVPVSKKKKAVQPNQIEVRVHKLFARHIPLKEQQEALEQPISRPVVNVFLGTPGRIKALCEIGAINLDTKKLKTIVFDCEPNGKGFTLFETHETRDDTFACFIHAE